MESDLRELMANYRFSLVDNKSYFKNCTFTYDSTYYFFEDTPRSHVQLTEVLGVLFEGNLFENTVSPSFAAGNKRGVGIAASQSGFKVVGAAMSEKRNTFNNLYYGITTRDIFLNNKPIIIDRADFNKNLTGCYMGASTFVSVTNCVFNPSLFYEALPGDLYSGLYLDNCTGYQVEENIFSSNYNPGLPYGYTSVGLVVNNSGPEDNLIYKNNFDNLLFATVAQNHNRSYNTLGQGLQYKCNVFEDNYQDISVTWDGQPSELNGIALNQGNKADEITAPAGNLFSRRGTWSFSDFDNQGEDIWYHMPTWLVALQDSLIPLYSDPIKVKPVFNYNLTFWNKNDGCPSTLTGKTKSDLVIAVVDNETKRLIYVDSLNAKIDNGNTVSLNLDVVTSSPPETMQLRDQLLDASPYLSDTVLANAAAKEEVLPNSIITEVLSSNPQSAKADNVLNALNARNNPPNDNEMAIIHANDTLMGAKEILESKKSFFSAQKQQNVNDLVRLIMQDMTITAVYDSIETILANISTPYSYYLQACTRYNRGDSTGVLNKLSEVTSDFSLNAYETTVHTGFEDYLNLMLTLKSENKDISEIDSVNKTAFYSIMQNSHDLPQAFARNILIKTDRFEYHEPYIFPDTTSTKSAMAIGYDYNPFKKTGNNIKLYPNPANNYIAIEYIIPLNVDNSVIEIVSLTGTKMELMRLDKGVGQKIIDLRSYSPGTYIVRQYIDGKATYSEKFVKF